MEKISAEQAAKLLSISIDKLNILEKQGMLHSSREHEGISFYSYDEIVKMRDRHGYTLSQEAAQIDIIIQRQMRASIRHTEKILIIAGSVILAGLYVLLITMFGTVKLNESPKWSAFVQRIQQILPTKVNK